MGRDDAEGLSTISAPPAEPGRPDVLGDAGVGPRVVRGGAARVVGYGAANVLAAVASVFLLRHLGLVEFGHYGTVMALTAIVSGVTDAGLTVTGSRELALRPAGAERDRLVGDIVGLRLAITVVGVAAAVAFAAIAGYGQRLVLGTLLAGVGVLLVSAQGAMVLPLTVELRNARLAAAELIKQAIMVAAVVALALAGASLLPFFAVQIAVGLGILAVTPALLRRRRLPLPRFEIVEWRRLARSTLPVAVAFVLAQVYFRVLILIMSVISNDVQTGLFVTSTRIVELLAGLPVLLAGVALPVVTVAARDNPARMHYVLQRMTEVAALLGVLIAVATAFAAEPVIVTLGGDQYRGAAPVLRIQAVALVTIFLAQAWSTGIVASGRQRALMWVTGLGLVAVIALGLALVPALEAEGAALAVAIADAAMTAGAFVALRRAGPGRELSFGFVPRVAFAGALAGLVPLGLGLPNVAAAILACLLYAAAALVLRLVPGEVLDAARVRLRRGGR